MEIKPEDIVIDSYCVKKSGWSVGTDNGVRITHKPTGISVTCDTERSQFRNKAEAFLLLERRLQEYTPPTVNSIEDVVKMLLASGNEAHKRAAEFLLRSEVTKGIRDGELEHVATVCDSTFTFVMIKEGVDLARYAGQAMYCRKSV